jgi:hypothetical protein
MSQFQQTSASTDEDVQLTQLITEGKNARGIPSAKFIVRIPFDLDLLIARIGKC